MNKEKFTVIRRHEPGFPGKEMGWDKGADNQLTRALFTDVLSLPRLKNVLTILGEYSKERIVQILGYSTFTVEVIEGRDNHKLPFYPPV